MALKIRLARAGAKKRPHYHIVVADARSPRDGSFIARLGTYTPQLAKDSGIRVRLDVEQSKEWIAKGAQPTDRVTRFLENAGVIARADRSNLKKGEPGKKSVERAKARAEKTAALEAAKEEAAS